MAENLARLHESGVYPDYESALERAYSTFLLPGMTVLDVGAHLGRHSGRFADLVGPRGTVIAFEPLPHLAQILRAEFIAKPEVEIRELALGQRCGRASYVHVENSPGESGFREREYNIPTPIRTAIHVDASTIDEQCATLARLDYVKMDIEGGEIDCLRGAVETIARFRPIISVEYGREAYSGYGHTRETLFRECEAIDYLISDLFGHLVGSIEDWLHVCDHASWDYFLVPSEATGAWEHRRWPTLYV